MVLGNLKPKGLTEDSWKLVVLVAGVGTILEYFDFYCYTQLSAVLGKVFFPAGDPLISALSYWGVFAVAFVTRPLGALIFGHIGDKYGRRWSFTLSILQQGVGTFLIGILPTYATGKYAAGVAAPVLLSLCRIIQGLAFGGEFGGAAVYISELADVRRRGRLVTTLQMTINVGLIIASIFSLALQAALSKEQMLEWGWRLPFLAASFTALIGYFVRRGLPEPNAFLAAQREEEAYEAAHAAEGGEKIRAATVSATAKTADADADLTVIDTNRTSAKNASFTSTLTEEEVAADALDKGALTNLHGHSHAKLPFVRLLKNNAAGLAINVLYGAYVYGAFFVAVTWLATELVNGYGLAPPIALTITIISLLFNCLGLFLAGYGFDNGMRSISAWAATVTIGLGSSFGLYYWVGTGNIVGLWIAPSLLHLVIGFAMALVVLPLTRIYEPLERTTGFSFGYAAGYGILGGISPIVVTAFKARLPPHLKAIAPAIWLSILSAGSYLGIVLLRLYLPRLDKPYVGRIR